jgi:transcription termination/antitermination protein NusA
MRSEFMLAFNEVCETHSLPKEIVIEALKTALVSAYRRNTNVSNIQEVVAEVDQRTGELTIFAEKEVVDSVFDSRTEVTLPVARRFDPDAQLGDMVMVESTPENFGRIAAQTAKQVILQRVREAEREQLFEDFSAREGEIVNGTVQSVTGQNITIGLGRTEAVLPKSQQVNGERYRAHDKIRVYVLEVRRTNRGPQIIVSRNHRNLLRRLLELEVPEIYNGQVDIKSIAREAGARSKVAVVALQPGIDPVGACVGMRGVRIQSIVRELNDEKIDVIEWDPDQKTFIAKALSPARVSQVFLEEHPDEGKTASVIVPDDQLSLAIGREGQNARLAAKLTGWRIDIKSLTEAANESLNQLDHEAADPAVIKNKELRAQVELILAKKEANRPITSEDYMVLNRLVAGVEGRIVLARVAEYEVIQKLRAAARKNVPEAAWEIPTEELELSSRVEGLLLENDLETVGSVILRLEMGEQHLLALEGFGDKALEEVKEKLALIDWPVEEVVEEIELVEAEAAAAEAEVVEEAVEVAEAVEGVEAEAEAIGEVVEIGETEEPVAEEGEAEIEPVIDLPEDLEAVIDDLETPLVELVEKPDEKVAQTKEKKRVVVVQPTTTAEEEEDEEDARRKQKGKQLVFDEQQGRVVVKRKRKGSRRRPEWEEFEDLGVDDALNEEL